MPKRASSKGVASKRSSRQEPVDAVDLSYVHESLRPLAVPIDSLTFDPRNANKHDERSVNAIAGSLREYGVRKPAVVQLPGNIIRAGEGSIRAAQANGWTHYPVVAVQEDDNKAAGFALADNRTAELSEWDDDRLRELLAEVQFDDLELQQLGEDLLREIDDAVAAAAEAVAVGTTTTTTLPAAEPSATATIYETVVVHASEAEQAEFVRRMATEGKECRSANRKQKAT